MLVLWFANVSLSIFLVVFLLEEALFNLQNLFYAFGREWEYLLSLIHIPWEGEFRIAMKKNKEEGLKKTMLVEGNPNSGNQPDRQRTVCLLPDRR